MEYIEADVGRPGAEFAAHAIAASREGQLDVSRNRASIAIRLQIGENGMASSPPGHLGHLTCGDE
jgi:hypothetical protein